MRIEPAVAVEQLIPTILCGGAGSRLWPVSRELHPKPFIRLPDGQSLLQKAFLRGAGLPNVAEVLTVTNRELFFKTQDEYREVNSKGVSASYLLEPFGRNTAPAIAAAVLHVTRTRGEEPLMLVLPADHIVKSADAFAAAVSQAVALARAGRLVTFGIRPESAETGYGYIEADGNRVVRFVEKPSAEKARAYVASGRHLWNSGMFCFAAGTMRREMERHCPEILAAAAASLEGVQGNARPFVELDAQRFADAPDISIDYAVFEKSSQVAVVPCSVGWSDIGSWSALSELAAADAQGNRVQGEALLHDVTNTSIQGSGRMIGAVGLDGIVIVDTSDALLVASRDRAQDVRHIYKELKARGHETHRLHRTVHRPWGTYTVLEEAGRYKIKRIVVKPKASLSLQMHHHRSEHWIVVSGTARVVNGEHELLVRTDESTYIRAGHRHRLENPGMVDLVMIEVQTGEYLGEDDIVRFDDRYGRS